MEIIDGRAVRDSILAKVEKRIRALPFKPIFCDVLVGDNDVAAQYVRMKERTAESIGLKVVHGVYPGTITTEELITELKRLSALPNMAGLIVQLPLPQGLDTRAVLDAISPNVDVDATSTISSDLFYKNEASYLFPTAAASVTLLDSYVPDLKGKKIVVVGKGMLVGKPVAHLLKSRGLDVTSVDRDTPNPEEIFKSADVILSGVGKAKLLNGNNVKKGVVIIDAGTSESNGAIVGDVDRETVEPLAAAISPVPGGVGPVTVAMLMQNVVISAERQLGGYGRNTF
ncbi:MAG: bifunctional 5,10-methylenetetrahydrofolate dehydrogenase/5,10-methenyltetrahydrofolate cyclohydrolase [Candidatus Pacebacteria bacterium]|nr:bifunctional 5,10-methylenetetrahydrofolate dehydrogenase/5,10-methenyltetrahydrofolate cyclohydrolase [Candidatus Paceibacterota bacterium]